LHPGPDQGYELAAEEELEIAVLERTQGHRQTAGPDLVSGYIRF
jgi:hypothetical protein